MATYPFHFAKMRMNKQPSYHIIIIQMLVVLMWSEWSCKNIRGLTGATRKSISFLRGTRRIHTVAVLAQDHTEFSPIQPSLKTRLLLRT